MHVPFVRERGFSLVEAIIAIGLLVTTLITLAYLVSMGVATDALARHATVAAVLATQKMEQVRAARTLDPAAEDTEYLDAAGKVACGGSACAQAVYRRRWSILPLPGVPDVVIMQVAVNHRAMASREARVVTFRSRERE
jgi:Tfp pilus assembly protein PilV